MDTNQNAQNYQVNTFIKGMNSDTSLDAVDSSQYLFGKNIRITNNTLLYGDINSNTKEGIVAPVPVGIQYLSVIDDDTIINYEYKDILATASIGNIGAIVLKGTDDKWHVYKAELIETYIKFTLLFKSSQTTNLNRFSVVINKEQEGLIKLYIADGVNGIIQIFLENEELKKDLSEYYKPKVEDDLVSNKYFPQSKVKIIKVIGGQLKTQQVQYTYRLYQKYGVASKLAPLTNKIQVINNERSNEEGNAEDTKTSIGFSLQISDINTTLFDHIQLYRISYIKAGQQPEINLIKEQKIDQKEITINDIGQDSLMELSVDEFHAIGNQDIIPKVIETNQGYMFASNIKDETKFEVDIDFSTKLYKKDGSIAEVDITADKLPLQTYEASDSGYPVLGGSSDYIEWRLINQIVQIQGDVNTEIPQYDNKQSQYDYISHFIDDPVSGTIRKERENDYDRNIIYKNHGMSYEGIEIKNTYEDIFTSSLLRSLRRDEVYRYGIVLYDKYGRRTDVKWIADVCVPSIEQLPITMKDGNSLYANSLGVRFIIKNVNDLKSKGVVGYEIVRCEKSLEYSRILLQCALSRPVHQSKFEQSEYRTPYYPNFLMTTQFLYIKTMQTGDMWGPNSDNNNNNYYFDNNATNVENKSLFQCFASEINIKRQDVLNSLSQDSIKLLPIDYITTIDKENYSFGIKKGSEPLIKYFNGGNAKSSLNDKENVYNSENGIIQISRQYIEFSKEDKPIDSHVIKLYDVVNLQDLVENNKVTIDSIKDVKNPLWDQGFTSIESNGSNNEITSGVKSYKSYSTSIANENYVNWIANGMYDLAIYANESQNQLGNNDGARVYTDALTKGKPRSANSNGWIGPGPVCLLLKLNEKEINAQTNKDSLLNNQIYYSTYAPGTIISNITHTPVQFAGVGEYDKQYDSYISFGNYQSIDKDSYIFDGDIYITPCEFISMFKTYDFKSIEDTLMSTQFVYYIPMETKINTFFDYGMNYRNTQNKNLQLEPGTITGITTQARPLHQYNNIYSDNDTSINVYYAQSLEKQETSYPNRIVYSQHKTNGEAIDNWNVFAPIDFVDSDARYGVNTELMTVNDTLYLWQERAFGKLSVNERSLITDQNSNTIQLGQGGVLQRIDYINTKYGMREQDYSAIEAENNIYWIDILNKAIVAHTQGNVINYGEYVNVQNIINKNIVEDIPCIDYDLQNMELLCKCLEDGQQLIFNTKLGVATSVYTRKYTDTIAFNNILYTLQLNENSIGRKDKIQYTPINYINVALSSLVPLELQFVVNNVPSTTKVFDNQKLVTLKRAASYDSTLAFPINYSFETDLNMTGNIGMEDPYGNITYFVTDREGNICYTIPREEHVDLVTGRNVGLRLRGKWMKVNMTMDQPESFFTISHIITQYRQSYN